MIPITNTAEQSEMILENNSFFIEERIHGRSFEYDFNKKELWEFINRDNITNNYYRKSWSRRSKNISQIF